MDNMAISTEAAKGLNALKKGDLASAYQFLLNAYDSGDRAKNTLIGLAFSSRALSNFDTCLKAVDEYLKLEPRDINANIVKADALKGLGQERAAANFYMAAIKLAPDVSKLPKPLANEIQRAQQACQKAQALFESDMKDCLSDLGLSNGKGESRVEQAIDILMGKRQVYHQKPSKFYLPELPQIQFYDVNQFEWARQIGEQRDVIQQELLELISNEEEFEPYFNHNPNAPTISDMGMNQSQQWTAFHLYKDGNEVPENIRRCPKTLDILSAAPIPKIPGRSPNILFSRLEGGAHIVPHHGQINVRLLCHLPLIVPPGCQLRVGNQIRNVKEGEVLLFDDSIEHEARNQSQQTRIVLIFDVWRPELSQEERDMLVTIFKKIESLA